MAVANNPTPNNILTGREVAQYNEDGFLTAHSRLPENYR